MARLPANSIKSLERYAINFKSLTKIQDFKFEDFEDKAEALDKQYPGWGYQLAYQETMTQMFRKIFNRCWQGEKNVPTLDKFLQYYDTVLMRAYFNERKAQGMEVDVKMNSKGASLEVLEEFKKVLDEHPKNSVVKEVNEKFASGELTLDNTYSLAKAKTKAKTKPTRAEARELAAYAAFLENRNKKRSVWQMLLSIPTHIKERSAIKTMRALARKCGSIATLMNEAARENLELKKLRDDVADAIRIEKDRGKCFFTKEIIDDINKGCEEFRDEQAIDENDLSLADDTESILNETLDLEHTDVNALVGDDAGGKELFGDESMIEDVQGFEKVEFDEEDIDIFPGNIEVKKPDIKEPVKDKNISK